ncbi:helix-hairpin-helix domain-containing protein [Labedella phragmitis]|uniref:Helix-hairpin-helix domain-containing protein n=1 Tax=Labedella phragmitis TaxID=2498849 RepID=A0A3S3ZMS3_9MICO|nr:helix-hairpin-helix domain-containing protein [Labedella phragmitis]RWZ49520.1 helix-hairpin-helix domain-containing protein [Labedella phragmitis]
MTTTTTNRRRVEGDAPSLRWLVFASVWLVLVLLPGGVMTWLGFAFIGFAVLRPVWIAAAVAYFSATVTFSSDAWGAWGIVLNGALWVLGIGHGLAANRRWLSTLWGRRERGERLFGRGGRPRTVTRSRRRARSGADVPAEAAALFEGDGTLGSDYLADGPSASSAIGRGRESSTRAATPAQPKTRRPSTRSRSRAGENALPEAPVDVNTATQKELQSLPGMTRQRAKGVVKERDRLGGFRSIDQFATVAALQPHELVRLTPALECSPRPRAPRTFGRRVEL